MFAASAEPHVMMATRTPPEDSLSGSEASAEHYEPEQPHKPCILSPESSRRSTSNSEPKASARASSMAALIDYGSINLQQRVTAALRVFKNTIYKARSMPATDPTLTSHSIYATADNDLRDNMDAALDALAAAATKHGTDSAMVSSLIQAAIGKLSCCLSCSYSPSPSQLLAPAAQALWQLVHDCPHLVGMILKAPGLPVVKLLEGMGLGQTLSQEPPAAAVLEVQLAAGKLLSEIAGVPLGVRRIRGVEGVVGMLCDIGAMDGNTQEVQELQQIASSILGVLTNPVVVNRRQQQSKEIAVAALGAAAVAAVDGAAGALVTVEAAATPAAGAAAAGAPPSAAAGAISSTTAAAAAATPLPAAVAASSTTASAQATADAMLALESITAAVAAWAHQTSTARACTTPTSTYRAPDIPAAAAATADVQQDDHMPCAPLPSSAFTQEAVGGVIAEDADSVAASVWETPADAPSPSMMSTISECEEGYDTTSSAALVAPLVSEADASGAQSLTSQSSSSPDGEDLVAEDIPAAQTPPVIAETAAAAAAADAGMEASLVHGSFSAGFAAGFASALLLSTKSSLNQATAMGIVGWAASIPTAVSPPSAVAARAHTAPQHHQSVLPAAAPSAAAEDCCREALHSSTGVKDDQDLSNVASVISMRSREGSAKESQLKHLLQWEVQGTAAAGGRVSGCGVAAPPAGVEYYVPGTLAGRAKYCQKQFQQQREEKQQQRQQWEERARQRQQEEERQQKQQEEREQTRQQEEGREQWRQQHGEEQQRQQEEERQQERQQQEERRQQKQQQEEGQQQWQQRKERGQQRQKQEEEREQWRQQEEEREQRRQQEEERQQKRQQQEEEREQQEEQQWQQQEQRKQQMQLQEEREQQEEQQLWRRTPGSAGKLQLEGGGTQLYRDPVNPLDSSSTKLDLLKSVNTSSNMGQLPSSSSSGKLDSLKSSSSSTKLDPSERSSSGSKNLNPLPGSISSKLDSLDSRSSGSTKASPLDSSSGSSILPLPHAPLTRAAMQSAFGPITLQERVASAITAYSKAFGAEGKRVQAAAMKLMACSGSGTATAALEALAAAAGDSASYTGDPSGVLPRRAQHAIDMLVTCLSVTDARMYAAAANALWELAQESPLLLGMILRGPGPAVNKLLDGLRFKAAGGGEVKVAAAKLLAEVAKLQLGARRIRGVVGVREMLQEMMDGLGGESLSELWRLLSLIQVRIDAGEVLATR